MIGGGPQNQIISSKIIIDETERTYSAPGDKIHNFSNDNQFIISVNESQKQYFVGTIPSLNYQNITNCVLKIERDDELTELWFDQEPELNINWIEVKKCYSFSNPKFLNVDKYVEISNEIIEKLPI